MSGRTRLPDRMCVALAHRLSLFQKSHIGYFMAEADAELC